jgi:hypothetical protein
MSEKKTAVYSLMVFSVDRGPELLDLGPNPGQTHG